MNKNICEILEGSTPCTSYKWKNEDKSFIGFANSKKHDFKYQTIGSDESNFCEMGIDHKRLMTATSINWFLKSISLDSHKEALSKISFDGKNDEYLNLAFTVVRRVKGHQKKEYIASDEKRKIVSWGLDSWEKGDVLKTPYNLYEMLKKEVDKSYVILPPVTMPGMIFDELKGEFDIYKIWDYIDEFEILKNIDVQEKWFVFLVRY